MGCASIWSLNLCLGEKLLGLGWGCEGAACGGCEGAACGHGGWRLVR